MKRDLLDILACPMCRSPLRLDAPDGGGDVEAGTLVCTGCGERYPIQDGIPNLLPPRTRTP